mgnify:CR=1 FL=1
MQQIHDGSILSPAGFRAGHARCGIKSTEGVPDVALLTSTPPAAAAGVFTQNRFAAAPVHWCRSVLPTDELRAVVVNAGNANACTGDQGERDVRATAELTAELLECAPSQVAVASTGIIGHTLPMDRLSTGVRDAHEVLSDAEQAARKAERAIMTTDTRPKACAVELEVAGRPCRIGGMAKGAGMIHPNMATMLGFVTTDADVEPEWLQESVRRAAGLTFNRITVDGDTSTNDSVFLLANGQSGARVSRNDESAEAFHDGLCHVMGELARAIARDGEGATKLIEIGVSGARSEEDADRAGRAIANSPLVKCAIHGGDPNWGRIVCAAGYSGAEFEPEDVTLRLGSITVFENGLPTGENAAHQLEGNEVKIHLDLGTGTETATLWTCDLSKEYVEINAEYHT